MWRLRAATWLFIAWTALGAASAYWGYRSIMAECPAFDDFAGCFEPPYRFAANLFLLLWGTVEAVLFVAWVTPWVSALVARVAARTRRRTP